MPFFMSNSTLCQAAARVASLICFLNTAKWRQGCDQIGVHLRAEIGLLQKRDSVLGREDDVHQDEGKRLRHDLVTQYVDVVLNHKI